MNEPFQLVTNCAFKGKEYLVQMCVFNSKKLELLITDKLMAEDWQCEYDASYIEALTHKTGNFKNFEVFTMMLKSGLLKTSDCIALDLLTMDDLEELRNKKIINSCRGSRMIHQENLNKRYLILTYTVEFDRIHYPLPLEYCGPPDPVILQNNIRRLEAEIQRLKQRNCSLDSSQAGPAETRKLKEKMQRLVEDNSFLSNEIRRLNKVLSKTAKPLKSNQILQSTLKKLEEQILHEKNYFHRTIWKLKEENRQLKQQIEGFKTSEKCLKLRLRNASKYSLQNGTKRTVTDLHSPEQCLDRRRNIRGERSDSQLTCRAISSWNSHSLTKPCETKNSVKRMEINDRNRSSSESGKSENMDYLEANDLRTNSLARNCIKFSSSRKSSGDRSRQTSCERTANVQSEAIKPVMRKSRISREKRSSSNASEIRTGRISRDSSLSSRASSRHSRNSQYSSRGCGDHKSYKKKKNSNVILSDRDELKFSVSDLESRIHALQKLLSEGLNF